MEVKGYNLKEVIMVRHLLLFILLLFSLTSCIKDQHATVYYFHTTPNGGLRESLHLFCGEVFYDNPPYTGAITNLVYGKCTNYCHTRNGACIDWKVETSCKYGVYQVYLEIPNYDCDNTTYWNLCSDNSTGTYSMYSFTGICYNGIIYINDNRLTENRYKNLKRYYNFSDNDTLNR